MVSPAYTPSKEHLQAFRLPETGNVQISFSGGRTSGYMLWHVLEANGGLPDRAKCIFTNTGREMDATYDFIQECSQRWDVPITWLEYRDIGRPWYETVSHNSASRKGEPFEALVFSKGKQSLPNTLMRFCTAELKIRTAKRYCVNELGWDRWTVALGIRADEQRRINTEPPRERWTNWYPLNDAGVTKAHITMFWDKQPFDLMLPNVGGKTPLGNCDGCFLKSEQTLAFLAREHPDRFQWWIDLETRANKEFSEKRSGKLQSMRKLTLYEEIKNYIDRQGDWIFDDEAHFCMADDGDCTG